MNTPKDNKGFEKFSGEIFFGKDIVGGNKKKGRKKQMEFISKICKIK